MIQSSNKTDSLKSPKVPHAAHLRDACFALGASVVIGLIASILFSAIVLLL